MPLQLHPREQTLVNEPIEDCYHRVVSEGRLNRRDQIMYVGFLESPNAFEHVTLELAKMNKIAPIL